MSVAIRGLREFQSDVRRLNQALSLEFREGLVKVAEPVRSDAELFAAREIRNLGSKWSRMRIGATTKVVYVAPATRRGRGHNTPRWQRPNLGGLLMDRAMEPALHAHEAEIEAALGAVFDRLADNHGF